MYVLCRLPVVVSYLSVHFSLVVGMLLRLVGIKECRLGTQSLGLDWLLSEVGTELDQQICSSPHRLIIWVCLPVPETVNTHTQTPTHTANGTTHFNSPY